MERPEWAQAMGRLYFAKVWIVEELDGMPMLAGINKFHDKILLPLSVFVHNTFIAPFQPGIKGFPIRILEIYDKDFRLCEDESCQQTTPRS